MCGRNGGFNPGHVGELTLREKVKRIVNVLFPMRGGVNTLRLTGVKTDVKHFLLSLFRILKQSDESAGNRNLLQDSETSAEDYRSSQHLLHLVPQTHTLFGDQTSHVGSTRGPAYIHEMTSFICHSSKTCFSLLHFHSPSFISSRQPRSHRVRTFGGPESAPAETDGDHLRERLSCL